MNWNPATPAPVGVAQDRVASPQLRRPANAIVYGIFLLSQIVLSASMAGAQVRGKQPDRGVYRPPELVNPPSTPADRSGNPARQEKTRYERSFAGLVDVEIGEDGTETEVRSNSPTTVRPLGKLQPVVEEPVLLNRAPGRDRPSDVSPVSSQQEMSVMQNEAPPQGGAVELVPPRIVEGEVWQEPYDNMSMGCDGCGSPSCDGGGCDGLGCDSFVGPSCRGPIRRRLSNASVSFCPDQWFGSAELMLMFRSGDELPPLVTTGPSDDAATAGVLGQTGTVVRFGGETLLKDMTAGGRFMVGTWLDERQCRSLTLRGWFAGKESVGFHANQDSGVLARPFLNVSTTTPAQDTQLVSFPDRASGSIDAEAESEVYGADVAVRQYWYGDLGGTVDLLYGYQYMRLDERLGVSTTSLSLDDDFAPVGSVLSISDSFEANNEFHGGQLGIASRYREGCWSFDGLVKVGFGQLRREARRRGTTLTSIDGLNATTNEGLLVRDTNSGTVTDSTFGWVPEVDLSLGWHRFPRFDLSVGYHLIVMTDALQTSGAIDPQLAVNLSDPLVGDARPSPALRYDTFYLQGIHFGLKYVY